MEPDSLAKALYPYLSVDFPAEGLRQRGWIDFIQFDHPDTQNAVEMGCAAFLYLFREEEEYRTRLHGLSRVAAYVCGQTKGPMPTAEAIREAGAILEAQELDEAALRAWFDRTCSARP